MKIYSQKDPAWAGQKLGTCSNTIGSDGCFLTCLSMLSEINPPTANKILRDQGGYSSGCMMNSAKAAPLLGLEYQGKVYKDPGFVCIAETDHYKNQGFAQHFFIHVNGTMIDPLELKPTWKNNKYHIVSYRLFVNPKQMDKVYHIDSKLEDVLERLDKDFDGDKEEDHEKMAKILDEVLDDYEKLGEQLPEVTNDLNNIKEKVEKLQAMNELLIDEKEELTKGMEIQKELIDGLEKKLKDAQTPLGDMTITQLIGQIIVIIKNKL